MFWQNDPSHPGPTFGRATLLPHSSRCDWGEGFGGPQDRAAIGGISPSPQAVGWVWERGKAT